MSTNLHELLVNAIVTKDNKILISKRSLEEKHEPGKWTIPGGKVDETQGDIWDILEFNVKKEVKEETGIDIKDDMRLICNNTFLKNDGIHVVAMIFLCKWKEGEAHALEDTIDIKWIKEEEVENYKFPKNVKEYIIKGFIEMKKNRIIRIEVVEK